MLVLTVMSLACGACGSGEANETGGSSGGTSGGASETSGGASETSGSAGDTTSGVTEGVTSGSTESGGAELDPRLADCLRINACEADGGTPIGVQACLAYALDVPWAWATLGPPRLGLAAMACKLAASDCEGVRACTPAVDDYAAACKDAPGSDLCQGDTWVFCDDLGAPTVAMDCAAAGLKCSKEYWAGCGAETCKFGETEPACDGDVLVECTAAGLSVRIDCPTQYNLVSVHGQEGDQTYSIAGETCGFDVQRNALGCIGTGAACDFFSQKCDGDVLETCAGGKLARRDCATVEPAGQSCGFIQSGQLAGAASCGLISPACDLGADETCADGLISFCDWDQPATLDCQVQGYGGCAAASLGDRKIAFCTP